ncbi:MAG: single-stranded DNA-binding protein [Bacteroidota bacterium]
MSNFRNRVQLVGHLGQDPEIKTLENGSKVASFSIATNDSYTTTKGDKVENTEWHNVVVWGKLADVVENYASKGKEIAVVGKLTHRSYETKEGEKRYVTEVKASEIQLFGK